MSKEITCRMIDGKPVVEYKEEYVPKKGDIVSLCMSGKKNIGIFDRKDNNGTYLSYFITIGGIQNLMPSFYLTNTVEYPFGDVWKVNISTPEEAEVMHHILNENGYELKGDTVVKKRWIPNVGERYWYVNNVGNQLIATDSGRSHGHGDENYKGCFKTEEAAQSACDKLNELLLSLPQE